MPATNTLLTINMITAKALAILHQKCNFIGSINRQYDDSFAQSGAKIGSTLRIRLPVQYTVSTTPALSLQNTVETQISLPITNQYHVDFSFSSAELTLSIDDFTARYIEPAIAVLAAQIEAAVIGMMWPTVWNQTGTPGVAQTFKNVLVARKMLLDNLTPQSKQWQLRIIPTIYSDRPAIHRWRHGSRGRFRVGGKHPPDHANARRRERGLHDGDRA
jgi:hypothetical protein